MTVDLGRGNTHIAVLEFRRPRYAKPRPAKTARNWRVYRARQRGLTYTQLVRRFHVNGKRIGDILHWCDRQIAIGRGPK